MGMLYCRYREGWDIVLTISEKETGTEIKGMETMESAEERKEVEGKKVSNTDEGYRALADYNKRMGQLFGPDLRGNSN